MVLAASVAHSSRSAKALMLRSGTSLIQQDLCWQLRDLGLSSCQHRVAIVLTDNIGRLPVQYNMALEQQLSNASCAGTVVCW